MNTEVPLTIGNGKAGSFSSLLTVGIIHYNDYDNLTSCVQSLSRQSVGSLKTFVVDNTEPSRRRPVSFPDKSVFYVPNEINNGYAGAANQIIRCSESPFVFLLNPDVQMEPRCLEVLLNAALSDPSIGVWGPKLLRETGLLDSVGHAFSRSRRFRDRGMGEHDKNQYGTGNVFAICGAAILLRRAMLEDVCLQGEYFDPDFFVYHEDTDLCWRAWHRGWRVRFVAEAVALHRRGWRPDSRGSLSSRIRIHGFKNRYLEMIKNETFRSFLSDFPFIVFNDVLRLVYAIFREPVLLTAYCKVFYLLPKILRKRREIMRRRHVGSADRINDERSQVFRF